MTIAVEESDRMIPTASAWFHGRPSAWAAMATRARVSGDLEAAEAEEPAAKLARGSGASSRAR